MTTLESPLRQEWDAWHQARENRLPVAVEAGERTPPRPDLQA
jgi:uncharacterized protein (DUF1684 family)